MLMIRKAFYHPRTATRDVEHDGETMNQQPVDQLREGPTKLDNIIKFIVILIMLLMAAFVIWNLHIFRNVPKGPQGPFKLPSNKQVWCEVVDQD